MDYSQELEQLERQKQLLVAESELRRTLLALQLRELDTGTFKAARSLVRLKTVLPLFLSGAFAAGFVLVRRKIPVHRWGTQALLGLTVWRRARRCWRWIRRFAFPH